MHPASLISGLDLNSAILGAEQLLRYGQGTAARGQWTAEIDEQLASNKERAMTRALAEDAHYGHHTHAGMLQAVSRDRRWVKADRGAVLGRAMKGKAQALRELAIASIGGRAV
jgi:hypothetical protein